MIIQLIIHYSFHFLFPFVIAWFGFRVKWVTAWGVMVSTMVVDLDHLFADPVFDPGRCSIGFHPLHSIYAIGLYVILLLVPNVYVRMVAVGLLFHMITDVQDCLWMMFG